jgi:signal transduction histidine kinase
VPGIASRWRLPITLRVRLTLLYGGCFIIAGAALLAITYGFFSARATAQASGQFRSVPAALRSVPVPSGATGLAVHVSGGGTGQLGTVTEVLRGSRVAWVTAAGGSKPPPSILQTLDKQQRSADQKALNALRARATFVVSEQASSSRSTLLLWSGVALGVMALLSIGLGWLIAGRALRPLRTMNQRAREITADNLHERLGPARRGDELGQLAATFDQLLARLQHAFDGQRRFVANASHELRTPLTLERTLVEVALADPDASVETLRHACERVLAAGHQQERLIDALLMLARGQAGVANRQSLDLADICRDELDARQARIDAGGLTLRADLQPALVAGDPALLERLVANLLDNAIVHNRRSGWIEVSVRPGDDGAALRIANSGETITAEQAAELTEPFRRLHGERTAEGGLGLGLSIVRAIALAHGATLDVVPIVDGGLESAIHFSPAASSAGSVLAPV